MFMEKKCQMCKKEYSESIFIYCDECMEVDRAIIKAISTIGDRKSAMRFRKALKMLRDIKN